MSSDPKRTRVFFFFFSKKKILQAFFFEKKKQNTFVRLGAAAGLIAVCGCHSTDPLYRAGLFHPLGSNATNLALQVADPADLSHGKSVAVAWTPEAVIAINRLRTHSVLPLPSSYVTKIETSGATTETGAITPPSGSP